MAGKGNDREKWRNSGKFGETSLESQIDHQDRLEAAFSREDISKSGESRHGRPASQVLSAIWKSGRKNPLTKTELNYIGDIIAFVQKNSKELKGKYLPKAFSYSGNDEISAPHPLVLEASGSGISIKFQMDSGRERHIYIGNVNITCSNEFTTDGNILNIEGNGYRVSFNNNYIFATPIKMETKRPVGRPPRPLAELPFPDLPRDAEANRSKRLVGIRLRPDLADAAARAAEDEGMTLSDWVGEAIDARLTRPKPS